jgi:type I restriction enzyme S subunit
LVGRAAVYKGIPKDCAFPDLLIRIRVDKTRVEPQYIVYYFQTLEARKYIEKEASGTSPSMKKVSQPKLERMQIAVPPLDEQRRIVAYLDSVQARLASLRELQSQTQEELDALLPSVLDKAFKGEL